MQRIVTTHCGLDPQSRGAADVRVNKTTPTNRIPSPLTADDQSLSQCLTLGSEGENDAPHHHVIADLIRNPEGWQ